MDRRDHGERLAGQVDAREHLARLGDPRKAFPQGFLVDVVKM
jgi:hypothetical protein